MSEDRFAPKNEAEGKYLADWKSFELAELPDSGLVEGEDTEETRDSHPRISPPPSGPPGGELHEPSPRPVLDGRFSAETRLEAMEHALLHLGDWYTEYKVPIRETTFWKKEVLPLLTK